MTAQPPVAAEPAPAAEDIDCEQALALLYDYLKRETGPELEQRLRTHLERCRPCFRSAQFERNFVALVAGKAASQHCPDQVRAKVLTALRRELHAELDPPAPTA